MSPRPAGPPGLRNLGRPSASRTATQYGWKKRTARWSTSDSSIATLWSRSCSETRAIRFGCESRAAKGCSLPGTAVLSRKWAAPVGEAQESQTQPDVACSRRHVLRLTRKPSYQDQTGRAVCHRYASSRASSRTSGSVPPVGRSIPACFAADHRSGCTSRRVLVDGPLANETGPPLADCRSVSCLAVQTLRRFARKDGRAAGSLSVRQSPRLRAEWPMLAILR